MNPHDDRSEGRGLLLGAGAAILMVTCCAVLPLLAAGGALAAIGGAVRSPWTMAAGAVLVVLGMLVFMRLRHAKLRNSSCCPPTHAPDEAP